MEGEPETALQAIGDSDFEAALSNGQIALSSPFSCSYSKRQSNRQRSLGVGAREGETPDPTGLLTLKCFASEMFH